MLRKNRYTPKIVVKTDHPHPLESPDYLDPAGSIEDNHSHPYFIWEIDTYFKGNPYAVLDIGCAGGQFVVDVANKGYPWLAVGLEGGNIYGMTGDFEDRKVETGSLTRARGSENWELYKDKCLFHADVSKPFKITSPESPKDLEELLGYSWSHYLDVEGDDTVMFNIVTAFEFFEHPLPEEIPGILTNINKHLRVGGIVVGTINLSPGSHHRCAKDRFWWKDIFEQHGFAIPEINHSMWRALASGNNLSPHSEVHKYPFRTTYRTNATMPSVDKGFSIDEETAPREFNFPFMFVKVRDCE